MYVTLKESLGIHTPEQFLELLGSKEHGLAISRHRAAIIQSRVYFFSVLFAILVPAWSLIDYLFLSTQLWGELLLIRLFSGIAFALIAWRARREPELWLARLLLAGMLAVTPVFHLAAAYWLQGQTFTGGAAVVVQLYALLPYVMVAGLTLFPLTLSEFLTFAAPMFAVTVATTLPETDDQLAQTISTLWLFILIVGVAMFSSLSQLRYMLSQVSRASYDPLTGLLTRRAGIEMLDLQFRLAALSSKSLSIMFCDLDHFKSINDNFGHDAGDLVLKEAANRICSSVRKGDSVIRWGGEEFIVILPTADAQEANEIVARIMRAGIGERPDGSPVTASIGVAEILHDKPSDWKQQVELADQRMYDAKSSGRGRSIGADGQALLWEDALSL